MAYEHARKGKAQKTAYREALRAARTAAIELATAMMVQAKLNAAEVPQPVVAAMGNVLRACESEFDSDKAKPRKNKPGQPRMSLEESRKILEDE